MTKIIRMKAVIERVGLSRTTIWRLEQAGLFVDRVKLSKSAVGYRSDEIDAWIAGLGKVASERGKK